MLKRRGRCSPPSGVPRRRACGTSKLETRCVVCAGTELYPAFQWQEGRLIQSLAEILDILKPHRSAWKILAWFTQENEALAGATPADLLGSAHQAVAAAARLELRARAITPQIDRPDVGTA